MRRAVRAGHCTLRVLVREPKRGRPCNGNVHLLLVEGVHAPFGLHGLTEHEHGGVGHDALVRRRSALCHLGRCCDLRDQLPPVASLAEHGRGHDALEAVRRRLALCHRRRCCDPLTVVEADLPVEKACRRVDLPVTDDALLHDTLLHVRSTLNAPRPVPGRPGQASRQWSRTIVKGILVSSERHRSFFAAAAAAAGSMGGGNQSGQAWNWCSGTSGGWEQSWEPSWAASWAASWAPSWGPVDGSCSGVSGSGNAGGRVEGWAFTPASVSCATAAAEGEQC
eukprot:scaffold117581_cov63-Phaeocystis_antarctica.AAC.2